MDHPLSLNLRQNAVARAHLAGAEAAALTAKANHLLEAAATAKRRYFRELETCDLLGGYDSSFAALGVEP